MEKTMQIPSEREFPEFASQTLREWWAERGGEATSKERAQEAKAQRGGAQVHSDEKCVAYFHGCYSHYNTTDTDYSNCLPLRPPERGRSMRK